MNKSALYQQCWGTMMQSMDEYSSNVTNQSTRFMSSDLVGATNIRQTDDAQRLLAGAAELDIGSMEEAGQSIFFESSFTFEGGCGGAGTVYPGPSDEISGSGVVFVVRDMSDTSGAELSATIQSCDGTQSVNMTQWGVYSLDTPQVAVTLWRRERNNDTTTCKGNGTIAYAMTSLEEYCEDNRAFEGCAKLVAQNVTQVPPSPTFSSSSSPSRQKLSVALAAVWIVAAAVGCA